jgi:ribose transport system ATP-binding protein
MRLGVSTIYQDVELIESLSVADNIFLGAEQTGRLPFVVDSGAQARAARASLDLVHLSIDEGALVEDLSAAQKQNLQIVKALHREARILVMDEPTVSLGHEEKRSLLRLVRELRSRGMAIVYVSHFLDEVFEVADTLLVLKDGRQVGIHPRDQVDVDFVIHSMVGRDASLFYRRERVQLGPVRVEVRGLRWSGVVEDVSFDVRAGEVFGIGGLVGSGRSELVSLIFGAVPRDAGEVRLDGAPVRLRHPADAIRAGIALITEDRKRSALLGPRGVAENVTLVHHERRWSPLLDLAAEARLTAGMVDRLAIAVSGQAQAVESLSGGNQQKTVIARWLLEPARLYIFDEPTKGVDIGAKQQIYALMVELARAGASVIMISSDMPELLSMSDRIGVMRGGRMVRVIEDTTVGEAELMREFLGRNG